jgi:formylmethanofuran dehydrogenase subunit D
MSQIYTPEDQNRITNNFNKVVTKAQNNEHSLEDMKAIVEYQQMKRVLEGKSYWVANPVKEKPPAKVKVTCGLCGEVKSKCPYKAKDRQEGCLVLEAKKAKDLESMVVPVARKVVSEEVEVSDTEKLAKAMFKRMKDEILSEEEQMILQTYEEKTIGGV